MKLNTQCLILNTTMSLFVCIVYCVLSIEYCVAQMVSSDELISRAAAYDALTVTYQGEVIGDLMRRGEFAWINVLDGKNAIGCWVDKGLLKDIKYTGSYKAKGDWVEVVGVFNRVCLAHGGDLDIHGQSIRVIAQGHTLLEQPNQKKIYAALFLMGALCLVSIWSQLKRRPGRK